MEIRNLTTFIHVAQLRSFTKAAQLLGYTQSTISFQIKQLETELNCLLFERINNTISLTKKGDELLLYAQKIVQMNEELKKDMMGVDSLSGTIHVVAPDSVCEDMILANFQDFNNSYPDISLKFSTADTDDMFRILDHNEADVIFTLDTHIYQQDYIIAKEEKITSHFVTGANSPLAKKKNLSVTQIIDMPFILTEKNIGYRRGFDAEMAKRSLEILPIMEISRTDIITNVLEKGIGISFLPDFVTQKKVNEGSLVYLDVVDFEVDIWKQLIYHKKKWISAHLDAFLNYVMQNEFSA